MSLLYFSSADLMSILIKYTMSPCVLEKGWSRARHFSRDISALSATLGTSFFGRLHRCPLARGGLAQLLEIMLGSP